MSVFSYRARDINGLLVMGQMEGDAAEAVKMSLSDQGLIPVSVSKGAGGLNNTFSFSFGQSVKDEELMLFTRQFHTLFKAGMDMETLLNTLAGQTGNKFFANAITRIKTDVAAGSSLSRAFAQHPKIFNELYSSMLASGEEAGILDEVLGQIASVLEKDVILKTSIKSATLYPKIVTFVLVMASTVMMTFVIPKFAGFFSHYKAELPLPTKIMIGSSTFLRTYWYLCFGSVAAILFALKRWYQTSRGRSTLDKIKWKLPVFGKLGQKVANARFANILGALYKAGLAITRGLEITANTMGHAVFMHDILLVKAEVEKGRSISEAMRASKYFSPLLIEATAIGEKSGALDNMYFSVGAHYDMEVQHTLKNLTTLLEPILLFIVFGMVAIFALAIFLPMWGMSKAVMG
ncbi:MAG TPA: type II secretion system F family protein [Deltaproteobacteria bacterium]|nr:type II secretion system F family protein [Deltaproteobacteria bacterium]